MTSQLSLDSIESVVNQTLNPIEFVKYLTEKYELNAIKEFLSKSSSHLATLILQNAKVSTSQHSSPEAGDLILKLENTQLAEPRGRKYHYNYN